MDNESKFVASIHSDLLPFINAATDEELAQFMRAQVCASLGEELPPLDRVAKAMYEAHCALILRLEGAKQKKSKAGQMGGAPKGNQNAQKQAVLELKQAENNQAGENTQKNKPVTITVTNTNVDMVDTDVSTLLNADASIDESDSLRENVSLDDVFARTYSIYPRKEGKARGRQLYIALLKTGREIRGMGRVRLNHQQIYFAVQGYAAEVGCRDPDKVQHFSTFMHLTVHDYVEKTRGDYEDWMAEKHGPEWRSVKFVYE